MHYCFGALHLSFVVYIIATNILGAPVQAAPFMDATE
jgi:hypothetical protein